MGHITKILATIFLAGLLISSDTTDEKLKEGYYFSSHGHATVLYKIKGDNIEWYLDNVIKSWGQGEFKINTTDSVINVSFSKVKVSRQNNNDNRYFEFPISIKWDKKENLFNLKDFSYTDNAVWIKDLKKRVKSSSKISVERPSR